MKLIVGLGNLGAEYANTRHNFGFATADYLANKYGATWKSKSKFSAEIAETLVDSEKVLFIKPATFYNLSGTAVRAIRDFYGSENSDVLIVHDEMALPFGLIRTRVGGSDAGNNGIKNLIQNIGADFARVRIGSGKENGLSVPGDDRRDFVLSKLTKIEADKFAKMLPEIENLVSKFIAGNFSITSLNP